MCTSSSPRFSKYDLLQTRPSSTESYRIKVITGCDSADTGFGSLTAATLISSCVLRHLPRDAGVLQHGHQRDGHSRRESGSHQAPGTEQSGQLRPPQPVLPPVPQTQRS